MKYVVKRLHHGEAVREQAIEAQFEELIDGMQKQGFELKDWRFAKSGMDETIVAVFGQLKPPGPARPSEESPPIVQGGRFA